MLSIFPWVLHLPQFSTGAYVRSYNTTEHTGFKDAASSAELCTFLPNAQHNTHPKCCCLLALQVAKLPGVAMRGVKSAQAKLVQAITVVF